MNDQWIDGLRAELRAPEPRPGFRDELRAELADEWDGRNLPVVTTSRPPRRWMLAAAAVVAVLLVGLVALARHRDGAGPTTVPGVGSTTVPDVGSTTVPVETPLAPVPTTVLVAPSTTLPLPTTTGLTPVATTSGTPTSAPAAVPIGLAEWPARRAVPPTLDDLPMLLPTVAVPGGATPERTEAVDDGSGLYDHVQTWFDAGRDASLTITTNLDQAAVTPTGLRTIVDATGWSAPWAEAFFVASGDEYVNLQLVDSQGYVNIGGLRVSEDEAIAVASSLSRRPAPQPGWDVPGLPAGFSAFAESRTPPAAARSLLWSADDGSPVAELTISTENAGALTTGWSTQAEIDTIDLDGTTAVVAVDGGRVAISWTTAEGSEVLFGLLGTRADAEQIVRSITPVDAATWAAATHPADPGGDGCRSLFC